MAAHAVDDLVEQIEAEEETQVVETLAGVDNGLPFPLPPLPPVSQNNYSQVRSSLGMFIVPFPIRGHSNFDNWMSYWLYSTYNLNALLVSFDWN